MYFLKKVTQEDVCLQSVRQQPGRLSARNVSPLMRVQHKKSPFAQCAGKARVSQWDTGSRPREGTEHAWL